MINLFTSASVCEFSLCRTSFLDPKDVMPAWLAELYPYSAICCFWLPKKGSDLFFRIQLMEETRSEQGVTLETVETK